MNLLNKSLKKILEQTSSEELYCAISSEEQDVLYMIDPYGFFVDLSPNFEKITGWKRNYWIGKNMKDMIIPQDYPKAFKQLLAIKKGKNIKPCELRVRVKKGISIGRFITRPLKKGKEVIGLIGIAKDIAIEREKIFVHSKNQLFDIFQHVADGVIVQDKSGKLILVNQAAVLAAGYPSKQELIKDQAVLLKRFEFNNEQGKPFPVTKLPWRRVLKGESQAEALFQYVHTKTRKQRWVIVKSRPIYDVMGKLNMVITITHDVTKHKELEERKEEFISMASHELKTPLTSINIYLSILKKRLRTQDTTNTVFISKIEKQMSKLTRLVTDLLDITGMKAGRIHYQMEYFNISDVINEVIEPIKEMNIKHAIKVNNSKDVRVYGDKYRITQVITNLLSNAIKYSPEGGDIKIFLKESHSKVIIGVRDHGIGIDSMHHKKIFEHMYQLNENTERTFPGLGIGLYISSEIVKRHNGEIWVTSNKDRGSTFYFSLRKTKLP